MINRIKFKEKKKRGKNYIAEKIKEMMHVERKYREGVSDENYVSENDEEMGNIILNEVEKKREKAFKRKEGSEREGSSKTRKKSETNLQPFKDFTRISKLPAT